MLSFVSEQLFHPWLTFSTKADDLHVGEMQRSTAAKRRREWEISREREREEMGRTMGCSPTPHEGQMMAVVATKVLLAVVFMGWLMMWVMIPTNTYFNSWSPTLLSRTNSTYFGTQGTYILIFTFPILFIAVVGSAYLHLTKRIDGVGSTGLSQRLDHAWRKPVITRGPLGVFSAIELFFCFMFLALVVWTFWVYLANDFSRIDPKSTEELGQEMWEAKLERAGLWLGLAGNLCCAFLFFPITRGSSLLPLLGLTSDASIKYHVWIGHMAMVLFTAHGLCYIIYWRATSQLSQMLKWDTIDVSNIAGEIALLAGLVMWATTFPSIRRKMFELFFYSHQFYIIFLFFYVLHAGLSCFSLILPGVYLFMVDRYLRFLQSRRRVRLLSARLLPSEAIELNFAKSSWFSYTPMSSVFINVPSISSLQWHPFTISSSSSLEPEKLSIIIKKEGSWTQKLYRRLSSKSLDRLDISLEGPYGPASVDILRYDSLVLVSGGSGITPFISIIRELIHQSTILDSPTPSILLICAFKTSADLTMLDLLLPISGNISDLSRLQLRVEAFVTREHAPTSHKLIQTLWFKPNTADVPVAPVLGSNGWLWLGTIISSSFVGYLVLMGIVTRYYIYPIDKNTYQIYSNSFRTLLNLLFLCVCITLTASAAFFWNKKRSTMEPKQMQIMDANTLRTSPDQELESVPHETLVQATKVHYGGRPNLKKMLLECAGSSVGVMASGPRQMRHEVASICSSGPVESLHFESISFSW